MKNISSVCTYVFGFNEKGEVCTLVGKRTSSAPTGANLFSPPMGMVDYLENPIDAAIRECFEETNIRLPKNDLIFFDTENYQMRGRINIGANFYIILKGNINDYPIGNGDGENERFIWLPLSKINTIQWAFGTNNKIKEIINKNNISMNEQKIKLNDKVLHNIIKESINSILKEYRDIDDDNYYGGGLPDKYLDDEYDNYNETKKECDGYIVEDTRTNEVIGVYRKKENARKKVSLTPKSYFYGFNFKD